MPSKQKALRVGFLFDDSLDSSDGVAQYVKTLGSWLSAQGHDVSYIVGQSNTKSWSGGSVISGSRNLRISWGGNRLSMPIWPHRRIIKELLETKHFDVLHVQVPYSPLMAQYVINHASPDTTVIGTFHVFPANNWAGAGARLLKLIYGRSLRRFNTVLSVSSTAASYAQKGFGITTAIMPNVIDLKGFKKTSAASKARPRIVFLGRLVKRKGCQQLIKAFDILRQNLPTAELIIAGQGPLQASLEKYVQRRQLTDYVKFLGFIDEADKPNLLGSADIACFPSLYGESSWPANPGYLLRTDCTPRQKKP
jgi:phosphatidylinositol alpha-mannosyltransferase